jgi:hypothetical protein
MTDYLFKGNTFEIWRCVMPVCTFNHIFIYLTRTCDEKLVQDYYKFDSYLVKEYPKSIN